MKSFIYFVLTLIVVFATGVITNDDILNTALALFEEGTAISVYIGAMLFNEFIHSFCLVVAFSKISDWALHLLKK